MAKKKKTTSKKKKTTSKKKVVQKTLIPTGSKKSKRNSGTKTKPFNQTIRRKGVKSDTREITAGGKIIRISVRPDKR